MHLLVALVACSFAQPWSLPLATFPAGSPWSEDVSSATLDPNSSKIIAQLAAFGTNPIQFDTSIQPLYSNCSTPRVPFTQAEGYYTQDCANPPPWFPLPNTGALEGFSTWTESVGCSASGNDCHVTVLDASGILFEGYSCDVTVNAAGAPTSLSCVCGLVWDTNQLYPSNGRGDCCTSVDAAGFPLHALLATPEEAATSINHAIRFILPNSKLLRNTYRHPSSHYAGGSNTNANAPPYGLRIRLQASFNESGFSGGPLAFVHALKTYGAFMSDGGNLPFTIASDAFRVTKWADVGIAAPFKFLGNMSALDFEVLPPFGAAPNIVTNATCNVGPGCVLNTLTIQLPASCTSTPGTTTHAPATTTKPATTAAPTTTAKPTTTVTTHTTTHTSTHTTKRTRHTTQHTTTPHARRSLSETMACRIRGHSCVAASHCCSGSCEKKKCT